jgi:alkylated DNA nucleotide flippase Atl1
MKSDLKTRVEALVSKIPEGRVMTYGQLAALCGSPRAARIVGGIAHYGAAYLHTTSDCPYAQRTAPQKFSAQSFVDQSSARSTSAWDVSLRASRSPYSALECEGCGGKMMPWHRVVNKKGGLASGYHGGRHTQKEHLEAEGVEVHGEADTYWVDVDKLIWWPSGRSPEDSRHKILDTRGIPHELY